MYPHIPHHRSFIGYITMRRLIILVSILFATSFVNEEVVNFSHTGSNQTFNIPQGVTIITARLWGAGGGNAANNGYGSGGPGGYTESTIILPAGTSSLKIVVGKGGQKGTQTGDCYGGGGGSGDDGGNSGGQGGGRLP